MRYGRDAGLLCPLLEVRVHHSSSTLMCSPTMKLHRVLVSRVLSEVSLYRHDWLYHWPCDWTRSPNPPPLPRGRTGPTFQPSNHVVGLSSDQTHPRGPPKVTSLAWQRHRSQNSKVFWKVQARKRGPRGDKFFVIAQLGRLTKNSVDRHSKWVTDFIFLFFFCGGGGWCVEGGECAACGV